MSAKTRILIVEDDEKLSNLTATYLRQKDFDVEQIFDGAEAVDKIIESQPHVVLLDLMLPGVDGFEVCRQVRTQYDGILLMLTSSEDDMDHVAGIELGMDDFVSKPVHPRVLLARINLHLRRLKQVSIDTKSQGHLGQQATKELCFGQLSINARIRSVRLNNEEVPLSASEFDMLWLLAQHAEQILSRDHILKTIRGIEYDGFDRSVDVKVANLRRKLGDTSAIPRRIITVRAKGYMFVPDSWS